MNSAISAHSFKTTTSEAVADLLEQLGPGNPVVVVFFCQPDHDGQVVAAAIKERFPSAQVLGCSTAGEISNQGSTTGTLCAIALPKSLIRRAGSAFADYQQGGVRQALGGALQSLSRSLEIDPRTADPQRYVGLVLIDGSHGTEEETNAHLGDMAPFLSFVGGSAGDNLKFKQTYVYGPGTTLKKGCALCVLDLAVPFQVLKTCHFQATQKRMVATKAQGRVVYEFDGAPATEAYAAALGVRPEQLDFDLFFKNPLGLIIEGKPWLRSPQRADPQARSMTFACEVWEGSEVFVMTRTGDLVEDSRQALERVREELGTRVGAALLFNCVHRRVELDRSKGHEEFVRLFDFPMAGFHTYGECWLGHINQTLTALVLGQAQ
ncbi:MAG: FIST C-terminal domain-containing protein [Deltaproteobacteria bacterium]|nr:FIST C-terminal domain-containing protein [Deltaproteobacteria bacterium]